MSTLTDVRRALSGVLTALPETVAVSLTGGNYADRLHQFTIRILVGTASEESQERLDLLLADGDEGSVVELLYADPTLGGVIDDLAVRKHSGHRFYEVPGSDPQLGSELLVEIYA